jgi:SNF2 family DNA or RNA helicase
MQISKSNNIILEYNGRLFPSWILKNFKDYKLPEIFLDENNDPCNVETKKKLFKYQEFLGKYLDYKNIYKNLLIYHGLGSGKTVSAINIYNMLYDYAPGWNVFILLKATLKNHPWISDLEKWLKKDDYSYRFENIKFISYDAPNADKQFMDILNVVDSSKKSYYIIEEAHNFIRNVYTNITSGLGKRAKTIYDYIIQDKTNNDDVRVVLLSGTPAINNPYELALLFNLLRPGIFPKSESEFNEMYISTTNEQTINPLRINTFQRRIMGLVSYYKGATPDYFAKSNIIYENVVMSDYHLDMYDYFEKIEDDKAKKRKKSKSNETYKTYTRQACNFVFPPIDQHVTGETRPRPSNFSISEKEIKNLELKKIDLNIDKKKNYDQYKLIAIKFIKTFDDYLKNIHYKDEQNKYTIIDDITNYKQTFNHNFNEFNDKKIKKSKLYDALYKSSSKFIKIIFNIAKSPGSVLMYSNYVAMEGLEIFKIYLKYFGYSRYNINENSITENLRYTEYHGGIDFKERTSILNKFNSIENKFGSIIKIFLISPAGSEGISLSNVRQVHIMEPYWNEVRIHQMIGRAIRTCSHKDIPMKDRIVNIYRYKSVKKNINNFTTDQILEDLAKKKDKLITSFTNIIKEAAVDCELFKNHNMISEKYNCFNFNENSLFDEQIGPAYKLNIMDDIRIDNGNNSINSKNIQIKVYKINAVIKINNEEYSSSSFYWLNNDNYIVYDFDLYYPIGKIMIDEIGIPIKFNKNTYIIDKLVPIPFI